MTEYAQADLRLCWSHTPHCCKYHVAAHVYSADPNNLCTFGIGKNWSYVMSRCRLKKKFRDDAQHMSHD